MREQLFSLRTIDIQILLSLGSFVLIWFIRFFINRSIKRYAKKFSYESTRTVYTRKTVMVILVIINLTLLGMIWQVTFKGISNILLSVFTVAGIAFFASWSILSNVTASLVLYFNYPFKIGDTIEIRDGDSSAKGKVMDINLFNIRIRTTDGHEVTYPNNLAMQKPIVKMNKYENLLK